MTNRSLSISPARPARLRDAPAEECAVIAGGEGTRGHTLIVLQGPAAFWKWLKEWTEDSGKVFPHDLPSGPIPL